MGMTAAGADSVQRLRGREQALAKRQAVCSQALHACPVAQGGGDRRGPRRAPCTARQLSGSAGRQENQQVAVILANATLAGCAFIDRASYLPEE